jgi:3-deoxy-D-manno-octulosonic-acid transferase
MIRFLYNLLFPLALLVILPRYLARMFRRGDYRRDFGQRFARYSPELRNRLASGEWLWVHAVSVGELLIALKLLAELHRRRPEWKFIVSSTTSTAHALALSKQQDWWIPVYTPVDFAPVVRKAIDQARPRAVILTESEMWPNFVWTAADRSIPVIMVNARVSPRSAARYRRFALLLRPVAGKLAAVGLQEKDHADLWKHLGVEGKRLHLTGSVKYDPEVTENAVRDFRPVLEGFGIKRDDPILLAGSTHEGEEEILAEALVMLRKTFPTARLLIAPRHVERTGSIEAKLASSGLHIAKRTAKAAGKPPDIVLLFARMSSSSGKVSPDRGDKIPSRRSWPGGPCSLVRAWKTSARCATLLSQQAVPSRCATRQPWPPRRCASCRNRIAASVWSKAPTRHCFPIMGPPPAPP